ncbi:MAG: ferrous iron transport protein B [Pseudoflavonifractor sp.]|nr:ferrous iron transport protein B [Alloprevotella sp.]MCM1116658.1 ferrous iron transport protein B [Pseudoflavonifractor sp.]
MRLSDLKPGETARIVKILGHGAFRKRLIEMGFVSGQSVKMMLHAPLHDPIKYQIMGYEVSLRKAEANLIEVHPYGATRRSKVTSASVADDNTAPSLSPRSDAVDYDLSRKTINVALIGNPNCGKTSLFNIASGAHEHVGNYSGVTVDAKEGVFRHKGYTFNIVDLPGTYSLDSYSPEERYVLSHLRNKTPDVIINVVVASNLERNLYLSTELIDMDRPMVMALNMYDELEASGDSLDFSLLAGMIGVPIVPTVSRSGRGIDRLFDAVIAVYEDRAEAVRHIHVPLGPAIEPAVSVLNKKLKADTNIDHRFSPRYLAIKLLEHDPEAEDIVRRSVDEATTSAYMDLRDSLVSEVESSTGEDISSAIAAEKYGFIAGALAETHTKGTVDTAQQTAIIDSLVTSPLFGFPIFAAIMFLIFWATFSIGAYPMEWIEAGVAWLSSFLGSTMSDGPLKDLVCDGIIGGVGGVIIFLPNILILYFCISFMEDSGYMARAAFIMDRIMHRIGLHGKSFIPLLMGFGCSVPAIMATRAIESRSSRLVTILITPFMSCSARLPIYILLVGTFFSAHAAMVITLLYMAGIVVAIFTARLLRRFWFKTDVVPFVMELPPYRLPTMKASLRHMWAKGEQYLRKMGGIILVASVIVWALNYFPLRDDPAPDAPPPADSSGIDPSRDSYLEMMGKVVNPIMEPLGMHWRATVAALAGIPAKEIVVSTLGVLYTGSEEVSDATLGERLTTPNPATGRPDFTPASAIAFLLFVLLFCPCIATLTAIARETGSWRYALFSALYNTAVAWLLSFLVYRLALLF